MPCSWGTRLIKGPAKIARKARSHSLPSVSACQARIAKGGSQAVFARRIGISVPTLYFPAVFPVFP